MNKLAFEKARKNETILKERQFSWDGFIFYLTYLDYFKFNFSQGVPQGSQGDNLIGFDEVNL